MSFLSILSRVAGGSCLAVIAVIALLHSAPLSAAEFPDHKPIKFVLPFAVGGTTDLVGRMIADLLGKQLDTRVVVENKLGASGRVGVDFVAKSPPDGYNLVFAGPTAFIFIPAIEPNNMPYDPKKDLTPVSFAYKYDLTLVTAASNGITTLAQMIDRMKTSKTPVNIGTGGLGTSPHLAAAYLGQIIGVKPEQLNFIHYSGDGQAMVELLSGTLLFSFINPQGVGEYVSAGKLRALTVTGNTRAPQVPDAPTMAEAGLPQFGQLVDWSQWSGIFAPAQTPKPILEKIHAALTKILTESETKAALAKVGAGPMDAMTLDQTNEYYQQQFVKWSGPLALIKPKSN